jgi:hypothetical protein
VSSNWYGAQVSDCSATQGLLAYAANQSIMLVSALLVRV